MAWVSVVWSSVNVILVLLVINVINVSRCPGVSVLGRKKTEDTKQQSRNISDDITPYKN